MAITKEVPHLSEEEVLTILDFIADCDPIVVGGQSTNIWAEHYSAKDAELQSLKPFTSQDIDFFANDKAAKKLASSLEDGKIFIPSFDDHTPNAAVVVGKLHNREIEIDFMATILGVDTQSIIENYVSLTGSDTKNEKVIRILLLHPADCVKSRLANINILHRHDPISIKQAKASLRVLGNFVEDLIHNGKAKTAQRLLHDLEYVIRDHHIGKESHKKLGTQINPIDVLRRFSNDTRLDIRWRKYILHSGIKRLERRAEILEKTESKRKMPATSIKKPVPGRKPGGMDGR